jgi:2-methylcitrate dehydratase
MPLRSATPPTIVQPARQLPAELEVRLENGTFFTAARQDYHGFYTNPFDWRAVRAKFDRVTAPFATAAERDAIADVVATLPSAR